MPTPSLTPSPTSSSTPPPTAGPRPLRVLVIAGEPSGDGHGAELVRALRERDPTAVVEAFGGPRLAEAGATLHEDLVGHAVMGLFPVLLKLPYFIRVFRRVLQRIREWRPDVVVPIDYPGLNLRVSRRARAIGAKVVYYVSPQVWAWWRSRVRRIGRAVDKMLVLFPFEVDLYRAHQIPVEHVGHPLLDALAKERRAAAGSSVREELGLGPGDQILALLPGSRRREIHRLLPLLLRAASQLHARRPEVRLVLAAARPAFAARARALAEALGLPLTVIEGSAHDLMREARLALVASGTATLECLALGLPMVIVYRVPLLSWLVAKAILAVPHIGLANIVCGKEAVPEFFDWRDRPDAIAEAAGRLLSDGPIRESCLRDLAEGRRRLGAPGASGRAAEAALEAARATRDAEGLRS